ncbi:MAG: hypothetical protein AB7F35_13135 [Acetobacteraceae bacterium]
MFSEIGESVQLDTNEMRRALALSETEWERWTAFLHDGPLPSEPRLPEMLHRLGTASFALAAGVDP